MAKISILVTPDMVSPINLIQAGVWGESRMMVRLRWTHYCRGYIFLLLSQKIRPSENSNILDIEVPDEHKNALKATLLAISSSRWMHVYDNRIPLAGPLADALEAEKNNVDNACKSILSDLGFDNSAPVQKRFAGAAKGFRCLVDDDGIYSFRASNVIGSAKKIDLKPVLVEESEMPGSELICHQMRDPIWSTQEEFPFPLQYTVMMLP